MLKQIQLLLSTLESKPVGYRPDESILQQIILFFRLSDKATQDYFIQGLAKHSELNLKEAFGVKITTVHVEWSIIDQILAAIQEIEDKKINLFKARALKILPNLGAIELAREEWLMAVNSFERQNNKRLTVNRLLTILIELKKIDEQVLVSALSSELSGQRHMRPIFDSNRYASGGLFRKRSRRDLGENPLLFASNGQSANLEAEISKTGARIISEPCPATPEQGYNELFYSEGENGNKQKVRKVFKNKRGTFFKHLTPTESRTRPGMVAINPTKVQQALNQFIHFKAAQPIKFTVTKEKIEQRRGALRRVPQRALTGGVPSLEVFQACCDELMQEEGKYYHLAHKVALCLGGGHTRENLVPATAAANYNMLEAIEQFIAVKLTNEIEEEIVNAIEVEVTPYYSAQHENDKGLIPDLLLVNLSWQSNKGLATNWEEIVINPRSHNRMTGAMHHSIEVLRRSAEQSAAEESAFFNARM